MRHRVLHSVSDETTQTVRCECGLGATFSRRNDTGGTDRVRALAEFACDGERVYIRAKALVVLRGGITDNDVHHLGVADGRVTIDGKDVGEVETCARIDGTMHVRSGEPGPEQARDGAR